MSMSAKEAATKWIDAKSKSARTKVRNEVAAISETNKRVRWKHLLRDIDAGDEVRIRARATGDWKAVAAERKAAKPKRKAKAKATTKRKASSGVKPKAADAMSELAAKVAQLDEHEFVSFLTAITEARR